MGSNIDNNTVSTVPTRFLQGPELVQKAMKEASAVSENWAYPVMAFGGPGSLYYAEIWVNGMDWQHNYYILESDDCDSVLGSYLFMRFLDHDDEGKFERHYLRSLWKAICVYRMGKIILKDEDYSNGKWPNDETWPFLNRVCDWDGEIANFEFTHASQSPVLFNLNKNFVPMRTWESIK